jgi:hypothetical protein
MADPMIIRCRCGKIVRGDDERALLAAARRHIAADHPELADRLSDDDLLRMASAA